MESEKIYCQTCDPLSVAALMNNNGNDALTAMLANNGGINNSPWMYLIFLALFGGNGLWGNRGDNSNVNTRLSELSNQMADNHNNDIALQAINGNASAIRELSTILNTDFNSMQTAICGVKSAIEQVGGQVGYTSESVKNAIAIGDANIIQQMQSCCCQNKQLVQQMGYEGQLRDQANTACFMMEQFEIIHGPHFNEQLARATVSEMYHESVHGEIIPIEEAATIAPTPEQQWDAYVGANAFAHDLAPMGMGRKDLLHAAKIFWFHDEDFPSDTKVFWYFKNK